MKAITLFLIIIFLYFSANAQEYAIAGKVTDSMSQKALNYATVAVYKKTIRLLLMEP